MVFSFGLLYASYSQEGVIFASDNAHFVLEFARPSLTHPAPHFQRSMFSRGRRLEGDGA